METSSVAHPKALDYLYQLQSHGIQPGLKTITKLLGRLSDPQATFQTVHIAGTNGKGSTAAMTASILMANGYRVGLYTSPHLIDFAERIRVQDQPISEDRLIALTERVRRRLGRLDPTFFEFTTALAFLHFAEEAVDLAVVEVGLGGRFDATNTVSSLVSVITNIDYDHQRFLGKKIEQIATEKAGIIKPNVPVVTAAARPAALKVIRKESLLHRAPLYRLGKEFSVENIDPPFFDYHGVRQRLSKLECTLRGRHQFLNAALALVAVELLDQEGWPIKPDAIAQGLSKTHWEGRLELVRTEPRLVLDGAHNPAGASMLREFLAETKRKCSGSRLILVIGILKDKDIRAILRALEPPADKIILTRPDDQRAALPDDLLRWMPRSEKAVIFDRVPEAIEQALSLARPEDLICVTGSLYTVGEAKAYLSGRGQPSRLKG
jgi:dihydrofolate synthase / folylpolyglutamate synthase